MKDNIIVVYMDSSFFNTDFHKKQLNNVGLGIYIIDSEGNDIKIGKGFSTKKIINATYAEIASLNLFLTYIKNNEIKYNDKKFIIYSDCEDVINILNNKYETEKLLKLKDTFTENVKTINVEGAYWVKGHSKEKGNLIVDTLAYNALRMNKDNNEAEYESININKGLNEIFEEVKRCPKRVILTTPNKDLNIESYGRRFKNEHNVTDKKDSTHYDKHLNSIDSIMNKDYANLTISFSENRYLINGKDYNLKDFSKVADLIIKTHSNIKHLNLGNQINITIDGLENNEEIKNLYSEAKLFREEIKNLLANNKFDDGQNMIKKQKEFCEMSDLHDGIFKLEKNKNLTLNFLNNKLKSKIRP
ncbi:hypothetical protein ACTOJ1_000763 [Shigella flexneri]